MQTIRIPVSDPQELYDVIVLFYKSYNKKINTIDIMTMDGVNFAEVDISNLSLEEIFQFGFQYGASGTTKSDDTYFVE